MWDKAEQLAARFLVWRISKHSNCGTKDIDEGFLDDVPLVDITEGYGRCPVCLIHDTAEILRSYYLTK